MLSATLVGGVHTLAAHTAAAEREMKMRAAGGVEIIDRDGLPATGVEQCLADN